MRTFGWLILFALTPAHVFAAAKTIFVADDVGGLADLLREELPEAVFSEDRAGADINVRLSPELRLSIVDRGGTVIVDRILAGSSAAVIRAATLLVVDATKNWQPSRRITWVPRRELQRTDPTKEWKLGGGVGLGAAWRWSRARPQPLYALEVFMAREDFEASLVGSFSDAGCCVVATEAIVSHPKMIAVFGQGRWPFFRPLENVEVSLVVALGYQHEWTTTRAIGEFAGLGVFEQPTFDGPVARGALGVALRPIERLSIRLDAGAHIEPISKVSLPDSREYARVRGREVSRGPISPFAAISVGFVVF